MAFKTLFIAQAPDADPEKNHTVTETGRYRLHSFVVRSQQEAVKVCSDLHASEKIDSVVLCPGFSHSDTAEIFNKLNGEVAVCVARGDAPSNQITGPVLQREFFGK